MVRLSHLQEQYDFLDKDLEIDKDLVKLQWSQISLNIEGTVAHDIHC